MQCTEVVSKWMLLDTSNRWVKYPLRAFSVHSLGKTQFLVSRCGLSKCLDNILTVTERHPQQYAQSIILLLTNHKAWPADLTVPAWGMAWLEGLPPEAPVVLQLSLDHSHTWKHASSPSSTPWCGWHCAPAEVHVHRLRQPWFVGIHCS